MIVIDARHATSFLLRLPEYLEYRNLLRHLVLRDLRLRYRNAALGLVWAVVQPLGPMIIVSGVFGTTLTSTTEGVPYSVYALAGLVLWTFFSTAVGTASMSLVNNATLLNKVYFPRGILPASAVLGCALDLVTGVVLLLGFTLVRGIPPRLSWLWILLVCPIVVALASFIGLGLASLNVLYRDVKHGVPFLLQLWMLATPVIYAPGVVKPHWQWVFALNPMTAPVLAMRAALFGTSLPPAIFWTSSLVCVAVAVCATQIFLRLESHLAERV